MLSKKHIIKIINKQCFTNTIITTKTAYLHNNKFRYYSKSSDIETLILSDNLKNTNNNNNSNNTIESIINKYPTKLEFEKHLKESKPIGKQLYNYMILSRYSNNNNNSNNNDYFNTFYQYLEEEIENDNKEEEEEESLEFLLEFNSKSYKKFDKLFSILFNNSYKYKYSANQYGYFLDSILQIQNKVQNDTNIKQDQLLRIDNLIIDIIDKYLDLIKIQLLEQIGEVNNNNATTVLNINHYNKVLEIYSNISSDGDKRKELIQNTLEFIYISMIKPDMNTYITVFPFISSEQSAKLLSKTKGDSGFKSGPNTYQSFLNFDKLLLDNKEK